MAEQTLDSIIADVLKEWADENVEKARGILDKYGAVASNNLRDSLFTTDTYVNGSNISIGIGFKTGANKIDATDYYKFVDEGVKGIGHSGSSIYNAGKGKKRKDGAPIRNSSPIRQALTTGRYRFRNSYVGRKMWENIEEWITDKGIQVRYNKSESKGTVMNRRKSVAYAIAKNIKRTGIGKTMFWSDTFNEKAYKDLADRIAKKLGDNYTIELRGL